MPVIATLFLLFAARSRVIAWRIAAPIRRDVTYWDVAGALTLIGLFARAHRSSRTSWCGSWSASAPSD